jgi:hypothetical protein
VRDFLVGMGALLGLVAVLATIIFGIPWIEVLVDKNRCAAIAWGRGHGITQHDTFYAEQCRGQP